MCSKIHHENFWKLNMADQDMDELRDAVAGITQCHAQPHGAGRELHGERACDWPAAPQQRPLLRWRRSLVRSPMGMNFGGFSKISWAVFRSLEKWEKKSHWTL